VITEFSVPGLVPGTAGLGGLSAGPGGAVWFIAGQDIDRITADGTVTSFPVGPALDSDLTTGADGNLWFAFGTVGGTAVGRMTPCGSVTLFPLPASNVVAQDLVPGPDGAVWFSEGYISNGAIPKIGRITTAGAITEYALPTPGAFPNAITAGPDGSLWFDDYVSPDPDLGRAAVVNFGQIGPGPTIVEYPMPFSVGSYDPLAFGPGGNFWFTESGHAMVGEVI
jgi:virginiamycin B lyase